MVLSQLASMRKSVRLFEDTKNHTLLFSSRRALGKICGISVRIRLELKSRRGALLLHKAAWNAQQPHSGQIFSLIEPRADAVWIIIFPAPHVFLVRYTGGIFSL